MYFFCGGLCLCVLAERWFVVCSCIDGIDGRCCGRGWRGEVCGGGVGQALFAIIPRARAGFDWLSCAALCRSHPPIHARECLNPPPPFPSLLDSYIDAETHDDSERLPLVVPGEDKNDPTNGVLLRFIRHRPDLEAHTAMLTALGGDLFLVRAAAAESCDAIGDCGFECSVLCCGLHTNWLCWCVRSGSF